MKGAVHNTYVTPDGKFVVSGSVAAKTITVIDQKTEEPVWSLVMDQGIRPMAFATNPDGSTKWIFAQLSGFNGFAVVDFATHKEINRIKNPDLPAGKAPYLVGGSESHGMAITADGKTLIVNSRLNSQIYSYSLPDLKLTGSADVGRSPDWVTLTPDGKTAYVACAASNYVSVVDIKTMKEFTRIKVGQVPKRNITAILPSPGACRQNVKTMRWMIPWLPVLTALAASPCWSANNSPCRNGHRRPNSRAALERGGAVFKGIPFAQPPVEALRWREPQPVKPWTGVRATTSFGAPCAQNSGGRVLETSREDCLFLNVWTPEWPPGARKPVMFWMHGGGNYGGSTGSPNFDGESLARHGVVLVSASYRLTAFGFFAHPELTRESPHHASGNYGLMDQIAALQWVRANIARFGGDPGNVTIFGQSAGAVDDTVLMTSPLAKGLFQKVIAESGTVTRNPDAATLAMTALGPLMPVKSGDVTYSDAPALAEAEKSGEELPLSGDRACLSRSLPAADILKATASPRKSIGPANGVVVDGWVLPRAPAEVFATGHEHRVPLLAGNNARERTPPRHSGRFGQGDGSHVRTARAACRCPLHNAPTRSMAMWPRNGWWTPCIDVPWWLSCPGTRLPEIQPGNTSSTAHAPGREATRSGTRRRSPLCIRHARFARRS